MKYSLQPFQYNQQSYDGNGYFDGCVGPKKTVLLIEFNNLALDQSTSFYKACIDCNIGRITNYDICSEKETCRGGRYEVYDVPAFSRYLTEVGFISLAKDFMKKHKKAMKTFNTESANEKPTPCNLL